ncbi:MAG TPA: PKD domain-containing protein [Candidatus Poseidoniaceae archaeon]|nr:PKD domain-containing protein [Candidatus Poseidoniaceae archaeon]
MSKRSNSYSSKLIIGLLFMFLAASFSPLVSANPNENNEENEDLINQTSEPYVIGDLNYFIPEVDGRQYLFSEEEPVYSASRWMKGKYIDAGEPFEPEISVSSTKSSTSSRAHSGCTPGNDWTEGESGTVSISGGSIDVVAEKVTTNAAFLVGTSSSVNIATLNSFATDWETTVFPTVTNLYLSGSMPDRDGNCQVEIILYDIDGGGGVGGYFSPGIANSGESIFVDAADTGGSFGRVILAHEFQHLLHNHADPSEYLWIDEGNADMAAFFCFGMDSSLRGHINAWTSRPDVSISWWDQKEDTSDYGAGMLFMLYLHDMLGGANAMAQLVSDQASGGFGITNLLANPPGGVSSPIGSTFSDAMANFSVAAVLDSDQAPYGFDSIDMMPSCGGSSSICRVQPSETHSTWSQPWSSPSVQIEGWGLAIFKMVADGNAGKLNLRLTAEIDAFDGILAAVDNNGIVTTAPLDFTSGPDNNADGNPDYGEATGLVPGFGNGTEEVYAITWFESLPSDCNYEDCYSTLPPGFTSYPTSSVSIDANVITGPPTLNPSPVLNYTDRDGDGGFDTIQVDTYVTSQAYSEKVDVLLEVYDSTNNMIDSTTSRVTAGGGQPVTFSSWFTPQLTDTYTIVSRLVELTGSVIDTQVLPNIFLENLMPDAIGSINTFEAETWDQIQFSASGEDKWGLSTDNVTLPNIDDPVAYEWTFGDGSTSTLKNPRRAYTSVGFFPVTLRVQDLGGGWSDTLNWSMNITDESIPNIEIRINGQSLSQKPDWCPADWCLDTDQATEFSAYRASDNVPIELLEFSWAFGDGIIESGTGMYEVVHAWTEGESDGRSSMMNLSISDGTNIAYLELEILVMNRVPRQIFTGDFVTETLVPITLPDVFVDDDGTITNIIWEFEGEVNLDGNGITFDSSFIEPITSTDSNPSPAWKFPGTYNVTITATDDDGNQSLATFIVIVNNQRPVPIMNVYDNLGNPLNLVIEEAVAGRNYTFDSASSYDPDSSDALMAQWIFSDGFSTNISTSETIGYQFNEPGDYSVTLIITDSLGLESLSLERVIRISNPAPIINAKILDAWINGEIVNENTPRTNDSVFTYTSTFTGDGEVFAAPGTLLFFDSSGTRDGDFKYAGFSNPDQSQNDWNGIVEYSWNFGDAGPISNEPSPWHSYNSPGVYTVTLTVRDNYGTGDTSQIQFKIRIDEAPVFNQIQFSSGIEQIVEDFSIAISASAEDSEFSSGLIACRDLNPSIDDDEDGITENDCDTDVNTEIKYYWDFDSRYEDVNIAAAMDGDNSNDYIVAQTLEYMWNDTGNTVITLKICDGIDHCSIEYFPIKILLKQTDAEEEPFDWADPNSYFNSEIGGSSAIFIGSILAVLILGYFAMRQPNEIEEEAEDAAQTYEVEEVEVKGGVMGMDNHTPPPKPAVLEKDERRSSSSGYVRPVKGK